MCRLGAMAEAGKGKEGRILFSLLIMRAESWKHRNF